MYRLSEGKKDTVDLKRVQQACAGAMYIVGIIPIRPIETRTRRIGSMDVGMDMESLLNKYFDTKKELSDRRKILIEKTMHLLETQDQADCA